MCEAAKGPYKDYIRIKKAKAVNIGPPSAYLHSRLFMITTLKVRRRNHAESRVNEILFCLFVKLLVCSVAVFRHIINNTKNYITSPNHRSTTFTCLSTMVRQL
jgi:hypothetical protein